MMFAMRGGIGGIALGLGSGLGVVVGGVSASGSWDGRTQGVSQDSRKRCMRAAPDGEGERQGGEGWEGDNGCWVSGRGEEQGEVPVVTGDCSSAAWVEGEEDSVVDDP